MGLTLNEKIRELENKLLSIQTKLDNLTIKTEGKSKTPYSKSGQYQDRSTTFMVSPEAGYGASYGGKIMWNDTELGRPPLNAKPDDRPQKGYNIHMHSRYAGGALDINTLELVEYDIDLSDNWETDVPNLKEWNDANYSKHCADYWDGLPSIKTAQNSDNENVYKIGNLDITFNADTRKWEAGGGANINVETTQLIKYASSGAIEKDSSLQDKSSPLYNDDTSKTNVVWDETNNQWRFYSVYADD